MRKRRQAGSPFKVIIMSATLSTRLFSEYFGCTVLSASGRTHPVTQVSAPSVHSVAVSQAQYGCPAHQQVLVLAPGKALRRSNMLICHIPVIALTYFRKVNG